MGIGAACIGGVVGFAVAWNVLSRSLTPSGNALPILEEKVRVVEESDLIDVVARAQESVVSIQISKEVALFDGTGPFFDDFFFGQMIPRDGERVQQQIGGGSGFIISEDGLILTNRHVVQDTEATYTVVLANGETYNATIIDRDFLNDIAFVKIEATGLTPLPLGDSDEIKIGQTAIAIGNALSEYSNTVTKGIVSGVDRQIVAGNGLGQQTQLEEAIQTDAAINPGNSGGPLLNSAGQVIGINTAVNRAGEGIGFAIPINQAKALIEDIITEGRIIRPFLGVQYFEINERIATREELPIDHGALIAGGQGGAIVPDSPAAQAGLQEMDIIYKVNDDDITIDDGLAEVLARYEPGDTVTLHVRRGDDDLEIPVTLADRKEFE